MRAPDMILGIDGKPVWLSLPLGHAGEQPTCTGLAGREVEVVGVDRALESIGEVHGTPFAAPVDAIGADKAGVEARHPPIGVESIEMPGGRAFGIVQAA